MKDRICMAIAWRLPRRLVYWAAIRLMAAATAGKWSSQIVPDLTALDALSRWDEVDGKCDLRGSWIKENTDE